MRKYDKGNVIEKRGLVFKDDYTPDPKGVHPIMIAIDVVEDSEDMYFLSLTSRTDKYFDQPECRDQYYLLKSTNYNMLRKSSLVNLQNIYKEPIASDIPVAYVQPDEYKKIMRKFKEWQEKVPDEFYEELKSQI